MYARLWSQYHIIMQQGTEMNGQTWPTSIYYASMAILLGSSLLELLINLDYISQENFHGSSVHISCEIHLVRF